MSMVQSTVKWFDAKKGYGFINHPEGGDDVFVHYSQIESDDDFKTLRTGQEVEFEMNDGPKGLHALNVNPLDESSEASEEESPAAEEEAEEESAREAGTSSDGSASPVPSEATSDA